MSPARRVLLLSTGLDPGGAEIQVVALARSLAGRVGTTVQVVSLLPPGRLAADLEEAGIVVQGLGMRRGRPDPRAVWRLRRIWRAFDPHIVHAHMIHANLLARVTRTVAPCPALICTAHSADEGGGWRTWAYRLTDRLSDRTVQVSRAGAAAYGARGLVDPRRLVHLPNGIPPRASRPAADTPLGRGFHWVCVGRMSQELSLIHISEPTRPY